MLWFLVVKVGWLRRFFVRVYLRRRVQLLFSMYGEIYSGVSRLSFHRMAGLSSPALHRVLFKDGKLEALKFGLCDFLFRHRHSVTSFANRFNFWRRVQDNVSLRSVFIPEFGSRVLSFEGNPFASFWWLDGWCRYRLLYIRWIYLCYGLDFDKLFFKELNKKQK